MNYTLLRETFYNTYKSYMDFLRLTNEEKEMFYILILRKKLENGLTNVEIIINSISHVIEKQNYRLKNNAVLNDIEANQLINDIREDFKLKHYISYSTVNKTDKIQRLQNTNYSLNIKLINSKEVTEALEFNQEINQNKERNKALIKK